MNRSKLKLTTIIALTAFTVAVIPVCLQRKSANAASKYTYKKGFTYEKISPNIEKRITGKSYRKNNNTITTFMSSRIRHGASTYIAKNIFNVSNYYYRKMAIILNYTNSHEDIDLHCFNDVNSFIDTDTLIKKISEGTDLPERTVRNTLAVCRINNPIFRDSTKVFVDQTSYSNHEDSYVDNEDISIALSELDNIDQQIIIYKFELNHKPALSDEDIAKRLSLSQEDVVSRLACCLKILENSLVLKKYIRRCNLPALQQDSTWLSIPASESILSGLMKPQFRFEETVIPMMEVCICRSISGIKRTNICFRLIRNAGFDQPEANIMDIFETY